MALRPAGVAVLLCALFANTGRSEVTLRFPPAAHPLQLGSEVLLTQARFFTPPLPYTATDVTLIAGQQYTLEWELSFPRRSEDSGASSPSGYLPLNITESLWSYSVEFLTADGVNPTKVVLLEKVIGGPGRLQLRVTMPSAPCQITGCRIRLKQWTTDFTLGENHKPSGFYGEPSDVFFFSDANVFLVDAGAGSGKSEQALCIDHGTWSGTACTCDQFYTGVYCTELPLCTGRADDVIAVGAECLAGDILCPAQKIGPQCVADGTITSDFQRALYEDNFRQAHDRTGALVFELFWRLIGTKIEFVMRGKSRSWIGIGFRPAYGPEGARDDSDKEMDRVDMIIGKVSDAGKVHVDDYYSFRQGKPVKDVDTTTGSDDILDFAGFEFDGWTTIKFRRNTSTADPLDVSFVAGKPFQFMYAMGQDAGNYYPKLSPAMVSAVPAVYQRDVLAYHGGSPHVGYWEVPEPQNRNPTRFRGLFGSAGFDVLWTKPTDVATNFQFVRLIAEDVKLEWTVYPTEIEIQLTVGSPASPSTDAWVAVGLQEAGRAGFVSLMRRAEAFVGFPGASDPNKIFKYDLPDQPGVGSILGSRVTTAGSSTVSQSLSVIGPRTVLNVRRKRLDGLATWEKLLPDDTPFHILYAIGQSGHSTYQTMGPHLRADQVFIGSAADPDKVPTTPNKTETVFGGALDYSYTVRKDEGLIDFEIKRNFEGASTLNGLVYVAFVPDVCRILPDDECLKLVTEAVVVSPCASCATANPSLYNFTLLPRGYTQTHLTAAAYNSTGQLRNISRTVVNVERLKRMTLKFTKDITKGFPISMVNDTVSMMIGLSLTDTVDTAGVLTTLTHKLVIQFGAGDAAEPTTTPFVEPTRPKPATTRGNLTDFSKLNPDFFDDPKKFSHGAAMFLALGLMFPMANVLTSYWRGIREHVTKIHVILNMIVLVIASGGISVMYESVESKGKPHAATGHGVFGLLVMAFLYLNAVLGLVVSASREGSIIRYVNYMMHAWLMSGAISILVVITIALGMAEYGAGISKYHIGAYIVYVVALYVLVYPYLKIQSRIIQRRKKKHLRHAPSPPGTAQRTGNDPDAAKVIYTPHGTKTITTQTADAEKRTAGGGGYSPIAEPSSSSAGAPNTAAPPPVPTGTGGPPPARRKKLPPERQTHLTSPAEVGAPSHAAPAPGFADAGIAPPPARRKVLAQPAIELTTVFTVGQRVQCRFDDGHLYMATIHELHSSKGIVDVVFEGFEDEGVMPRLYSDVSPL